jgi:hypothetical protein
MKLLTMPATTRRPSMRAASSAVVGRLRAGTPIAVIIGLAVLTWPIGSLYAGGGLDGSWAIGLSLAVAHGVPFGTRVVFTYGPLGLALHPVAVSAGTLALGLVGAAIVQLSFFAVLVRILRVRVGLAGAAVVSLIVGLVVTATTLTAVLEAIAFGIVVLSFDDSSSEGSWWTEFLPLGGGVLSGLALLAELNQGVAVSAVVVVGILGGPRPGRQLATWALSLALATSCAWLALGQPLGAIPDYISTGFQTVEGYPAAMAYDTLGSSADWEVTAVIASALILATCAWRALRTAPWPRRVALAADVLILHYFTAREMFTRLDGGHLLAIALLPAIALMLPWRRRQAAAAVAAVASVSIASLIVLGTVGFSLGSVFDPSGRVSSLFSNTGIMFAPGGTIAREQAKLRAAERIPAAIVADLDGHCVNAEPTEVAAVFAYPAWRWCPIGVMQSYEAYTPQLDQLDAASYANARTGPDRVLRQHYAIDYRNPDWESPAAMLSLLCHFREIARGGHDEDWQALARIPDRCGHPYAVATLHVGPGGAKLPPAPPGTVLIAKLYGLQPDIIASLEALAIRPGEQTLTINGGEIYRVIPATASDGLILDVPRSVDYAPPFNLGSDARTISAATGSIRGGTPLSFTAKLFAVPIS